MEIQYMNALMDVSQNVNLLLQVQNRSAIPILIY